MGLIIELAKAYFKARKAKCPEIVVLDLSDKFDLRSMNYKKYADRRKEIDFWYNQHGQGPIK